MYLNLRNSVWLLVLGSAAVGTWYLSRDSVADLEITRNPGPASLGYYLNGAVLMGTDENGEVLYRIVAERIEENPNEDQLILNEVRVEYRDQSGVPWRIQASRARGPTNRQYLDLTGDVRIEHTSTNPAEATIIETVALRLEPQKYFASTQGPVHFQIGDTRIDAVGLKAYLKDDKIDLESEVHGQIGK